MRPCIFHLRILTLLTTALVTPFAAAAADVTIEEPPITRDDRAHWSFRPLEQPALPALKNQVSATGNPIDHFVLAKLQASGLTHLPEADRPTLIRRLTIDLTGLPPTLEQIDAFVADRSPDAYATLVTNLLASPAYGERWAQHWLDLVRFAESDGFEHDKIRPDAWRFRDWVIDALNADLPYDQFLGHQLAGDELAPNDDQAALATGFLLAGPDMPDINLPEERRHTVLNEMTSTVGAAFMGLSLGCAACHDHKTDPVSQADFYRLRGFFDNTFIPERNKQFAHILTEAGPFPQKSQLMIRGDFRRPGPELQPAFLRVINPAEATPVFATQAIAASSTGRRAALARWLTSPDHPLTSRVIVNRLWQHHFIQPLVSTPNDFGLSGARPTHPELHDRLAAELPRRGWSLKEMHRLIVTSRTYRQSSLAQDAPSRWKKAIAADPDNELLSRMNRRRLSGETIRDTLLFASGRLNPEAGGPGFRPPLPDEVTVTLLKNQWKLTDGPAGYHRRSIYLFVRRNLRFPLFEVFDRPDGNASCSRRTASTTAPQSLTLLNSSFSLDAARHIAGRVLADVGDAPAAQVTLCHRLLLGRSPSPRELELGTRFLKDQAALLKRASRSEDSLALPLPLPEHSEAYHAAALTDLSLALLNSNAFLYVD
jgi:hypothetical protein